MTTEFKLTTLAEISLLSEDQFERMMPDFLVWFLWCKQVQSVGAVATGFIWIDDGEPGVVREICMTDPLTGKRTVVVLDAEIGGAA